MIKVLEGQLNADISDPRIVIRPDVRCPQGIIMEIDVLRYFLMCGQKRERLSSGYVWRMLKGCLVRPPLGLLTQTEGDPAYHAQASSSAEGKLSSGVFERALIPLASAHSAVPADASR